MLVGSSGSGKSTFINTLCSREVVPLAAKEAHEFNPENAHKEPGIRFEIINEELVDDNTGGVSLTFIDTPGFGDNLDNKSCFQEILSYIEKQFDEVLAEENRIKRNPRFTDNRVHALLYFINPTGHGLRETDVEFMKLVATKVNIVPVISKADSLTQSELAVNKRLIMEDLEHYNIPIYHFPYDSDSDEESARQNSTLRSILPFSIIGASEAVASKNGDFKWIRKYPWGTVDVADAKASDFPVLRDVLLKTHLHDLKETTFDFLYENYRTNKLSRDIQNMHMQSPDVSIDGSSHGRAGTPIIGNGGESDSVMSTSYLAREEQLRLEEERLRATELKVQEEIAQRRLELAKREEELRNLEAKLKMENHSPVSLKSELNGVSPTRAESPATKETVVKQES